jgi:hypothetical protein
MRKNGDTQFWKEKFHTWACIGDPCPIFFKIIADGPINMAPLNKI